MVNPLASNFSCPNVETEKQTSVNLIRLTGQELKNSFISVLPAAVWTALAAQLYLVPDDLFSGLISNFVSTFTVDSTDRISRFNEQVAIQLVSSDANIKAFFGVCASATSFAKTCFDSFLLAKGPAIFRSALAADDNSTIWARVIQAPVVNDQLMALAQIVFNDPRFIYRLELGEGSPDSNGLLMLTSYEIANRISFGMTSSPPDAMLWADAIANKLQSMTVVNSHVDRISKTLAYKNRVIDFVKFYVGLQSSGVAPDVPEFMNGIDGTNLGLAVTDEFNEFINYVVITQKGTLNDLFTSQAAFPKTSALASIMGTGIWTSGTPMIASNHAGLLTKPYMNLVGNPNLKLVQRGKRIRINMLCTDIPQPSATDLAARPVLPDTDLVNLNRRDYINKATNVLPGVTTGSCYACHSKMNQLGFATENYDSIGRFSLSERIYNTSNVKVSTHAALSSSTPLFVESDPRTFANMTEFQSGLVNTGIMQTCLTRKAYQFFQQKPEDVVIDSCRLNKMDTKVKLNLPLFDFLTENFKQQSMLYKRSN